MEHEVLCKLLVVEVLEQEARLFVVEVGDASDLGRLGEAEVGVKVPRQREVVRRDERLELNNTQRHGAASVA